MNIEVLQEIFNILKEIKPLQNITPDSDLILIPIEPAEFEKSLIKKFGRPMVHEVLKEMYHKELIGMRHDDSESFIKGHKKKQYFIRFDKLKKLI